MDGSGVPPTPAGPPPMPEGWRGLLRTFHSRRARVLRRIGLRRIGLRRIGVSGPVSETRCAPSRSEAGPASSIPIGTSKRPAPASQHPGRPSPCCSDERRSDDGARIDPARCSRRTACGCSGETHEAPRDFEFLVLAAETFRLDAEDFTGGGPSRGGPSRGGALPRRALPRRTLPRRALPRRPPSAARRS